MDGVTILDRDVANSVVKFQGKVSELMANTEYKFGDLFTFVNNDVELLPAALTVAISNLDENNPVSAEIVYDRENWENGTITFSGTGAINLTIQDYYFCTPTTIKVEVKDRQPVEKFKVVMNNGDFLHRVGNVGTVKLEKLFAAVDANTKIGNVTVNVEPVGGTAASGTYTSNATWTSGTIQFSGTGVVKVTITDDDYCIPTELLLEVVDATNVTGATNATSGNIVLLNNTSSSGITIKDGYAFYGNGFTVTCSGKGTYLNNGGMTLGYVSVQTGGVLDNLKVICDIYPKAFIYSEEVKVSSNLDKDLSTDGSNRYMYQLSAISVSGDGSVVANSYAYGGRNNIYVGGGDVIIENTVTECGTLANIQIKGSSDDTVTIKDVTTIQYLTTSKYDPESKMIGFGIVVGDNESEANANIILQGDLKQYNWVTEADKNVSNTYAKLAIDSALGVAKYQHTINGNTTVNMGIAYLNTRTTSFPTQNDQRTNKQTIPYAMNSISMQGQNGYVYSISGSAIDGTSRYNAEYDKVTPYAANAQKDIPPKPVFSLGNQAVNGDDRYLKGDSNGITARYENGQEAFTLDITKLMTASKYGNACSVSAICIDPDGNTLSGTITLNKAGKYTLKFTIVDTLFFNAQGEQVTKRMEYQHTVPITLTIAEPAMKDATLKVDTSKTYTGEYTDKTSDGSKKLSITNVLQPVTVTDNGSNFSLTSNVKSTEITYAATGTDGNGNAFGGQTTITVTYTSGQVLKIVLNKPSSNSPGNPKSITYNASTGQVKSSNTLAKKSCTAASWAVSSYSFTGINGKTVTANGVTFTIAEDTSGGACLAAGTRITMADGSKKAVENLRKGDLVMSVDHVTGKVTYKEIVIVGKTYDADHDRNTFVFDDGTILATINEHGIFDLDLNQYVNIDRNNYHQYIGHRFVAIDAEGNIGIKKLIKVISVCESGYKYDIVTNETWNYVAEDTLSITHELVVIANSFKYDDNMLCYDAKVMQEDIAKYGLYTYDEWAEYCEQSVFEQYNMAAMKVGVGKGLYTKDHLAHLLLNIALNEEVQIKD